MFNMFSMFDNSLFVYSGMACIMKIQHYAFSLIKIEAALYCNDNEKKLGTCNIFH